MNEEIEKLLEEEGWIVECVHPFEIRHEESGAFASLRAAYMVVESLKQEVKDEVSENLLEAYETIIETQRKLIDELKKRLGQVS